MGWWFMPFGDEDEDGIGNDHACHHISKLFFIFPFIHLILLLLSITIHSISSEERRAWHEWWVKWKGWQSISKQATEKGKWLTYLHSIKWMSLIQLVDAFKKRFFNPQSTTKKFSHIQINPDHASAKKIFNRLQAKSHCRNFLADCTDLEAHF